MPGTVGLPFRTGTERACGLIVRDLTGRESADGDRSKSFRVGEFYLYHRLYTMFPHL